MEASETISIIEESVVEPSTVIEIKERPIVVVPPVQPTITKTIFSPVRIVDNTKFHTINVKSQSS